MLSASWVRAILLIIIMPSVIKFSVRVQCITLTSMIKLGVRIPSVIMPNVINLNGVAPNCYQVNKDNPRQKIIKWIAVLKSGTQWSVY
jgi:hypothetical protein